LDIKIRINVDRSIARQGCRSAAICAKTHEEEAMSLTDLLPSGAPGLNNLPDAARDLLSNVAEDVTTTTENGDTVHRGRLVVPEGQRFTFGNWRLELFSTEGHDFALRERASDGWRLEVEVRTLKLFPDPQRFRPGRLVTTPYHHLQPTSGPEVVVTATDVTVIVDSASGFDLRVGDPEAPDVFEPVTVTPRYIMMGETWGMGIGEIVIDLNRAADRNPAQVDALFDRYGIDDPDWRGLYLEEVGFYFKNDGGIRINQVAIEDVAWGFDGDGLTGTGILELSNVTPEGPAPNVALEMVDASNNPLPETAGAVTVEAGTTVRGVATTTDGRAPYHYTWTHTDADTPGGHPPNTRISDPLTYHRAGTYTVMVQVKDYDNRTAIASLTINVTPTAVTPPSAVRFALIGHGTADGNVMNQTEDRRAFLEGSAPLTAEFRSFEIEGGTGPYTHDWSVDGTAVGSGETLSRTFDAPGTFDVALKVTDSAAESTTRHLCVRVFEAPDDPLDDLRLDGGRDWLTQPGETRIRVIEGAERADPPPDAPPEPRPLQVVARRFDLDLSRNVCEAATAGPATDVPAPGFEGAVLSLTAGPESDVFYRVEVTPTSRIQREGDLLVYPPQRPMVLFQLDRDDVYPDDAQSMSEANEQALREVKRYLELHTEITELTIHGDTCDRASGSHNDDLSRRRAEHTRDELQELLTPERRATLSLVFQGRGEQQIHADGHVPVSGPDAFDVPHDSYEMNELVRERYRRVQFEITGEAGTPSPSTQLTRYFYVVVSPEAPPPAPTQDEERQPGQLPEPERPPFRFDWFKKARLELEVFRSEFVRFELSCTIDYKTQLYSDDGIVSADPNDGLLDILFSLRIHPVTEEYDWTGAVISPPQDPDGIFTIAEDVARYTTAGLLLPPIVAARSPASLAEVGVVAAAGTALGAAGVILVRKLTFRGGRITFFHRDVDQARHAFLALGIDYALEFDVDVDLGGALRLQTQRTSVVEIKDLGIAFDTDDGWMPTFYFDPNSGMRLDIRDQGLLQAAGPLGNILDVTRAQLGLGSPIWFETELGLNVNLGVFKVDRFGVRLGYNPDTDDVSVSLTSIGIGVDVPGVFGGSGYLRIVEQGFDGELSLTIVPINLSVSAAAMIRQLTGFTGVMAAISVEFSPGFPIPPSAAAIYGFSGLFAMHAQRTLADPLQWYAQDPFGAISVHKWQITEESKDRWAFGVGAVLGEYPIGGTIINVKGMFMIEIPGPRFMLLMHANILKKRPKADSNVTGDIFAAIVLDFEADIFSISLTFDYRIPHILEVRLPVEAFFNLADARDWHLYVGQDKPQDKRVRIRVFELWDAWGYLMIDGQDIIDLGGKGINLNAVAVATGFRISIFWGSRAINLYLEAYAELHVGLGFRPFMVFGILEIGGSLHVIVASIGARGLVSALATGDGVQLHGEVCGHLKILWWKVEKCIGFTLGSLPQPPPDYPFLGLVLRNRFNDEVRLTPVDPEAPDEPAVADLENAPIDCRPTINFLFGIRGDLGGSLFALPERMDANYREQVAEELYYRFRLTRLELVKVRGDGPSPTGPFDAAWYLDSNDVQKDLVLLDWRPHGFSLSADIEGGFRREIEEYFEGLCNPPERPGEHCFTFDKQRLGPSDQGWTLQHDAVPWTLAVKSPASGFADELAADLGAGPRAVAPAVRPIPFLPQTYPDMTPIEQCLRLPILEGQSRPSTQPLTIETPPMEQVCIVLALRVLRHQSSLDGGVTFWLSKDPYNPDDEPTPVTVDLDDGELITMLDTPNKMGQWAILRYCLNASPPESIVRVEVGAGYDPEWELSLGDKFGDRLPNWNHQYLLEICAVSAEEVQAFGEATRQFDESITYWNDFALNGASPSAELLHPNTTYQVRATVAWEAYDCEAGGALQADGAFDFEEEFTTASKPPVDLTPYLESTYPARGQESHYTGQPLVITMRTDTVEELYSRFGRELSFDATAASGVSVRQALDLQIQAASQAPDYEVTIQEALADLPCIINPAQNISKVAEATIHAAFQPNTVYTVIIRAEDTTPDGATPIDVYTWTFTTSRYANLEEHAAQYELRQYDLLLDAVDAATQAAITAKLSLGMSVDERLLEEILVADLRDEPKEPAAYPAIYRLWTGDGAGGWIFLGIMLDGPEPLLKRQDGGAVTTLSLQNPTTGDDVPFRGVQGERGARALIWLAGTAPEPMSIRLDMRVPVDTVLDALIEEDATIAVHLADLPDVMKEREN
jgi:outer membrane protein OmpA-like peptidoglycan-associated protein